MPAFFTREDLQPIFDCGGLIDATGGGLVLGNSHSNYGVKIIRKLENGLYEIGAEMEGWEYILNPRVTELKSKEIELINSELSEYNGVFEEYEVDNSIKKIDATLIDREIISSGKLLLISHYSQFIINKHSTKKYLHILNKLNVDFPFK